MGTSESVGSCLNPSDGLAGPEEVFEVNGLVAPWMRSENQLISDLDPRTQSGISGNFAPTKPDFAIPGSLWRITRLRSPPPFRRLAMKDDPVPYDLASTHDRFRVQSPCDYPLVSRTVAEAWSLGELDSIWVRSSPRNTSRREYRFVAGDTVYSLHESPSNTPIALRSCSELHSRLAGAGIGTPLNLDTHTGEAFAYGGGKRFRLSQAIDGEYFDGSRRELVRAARSLAGMHTALAQAPMTGVDWKYEPNSMMLPKLEEMAAAGKNAFDGIAMAAIASIRNQPDTVPGAIRDLPRQLGHSDLHPHHMLFDGPEGRVVGILDFDRSRVLERARDVAMTGLCFARTFGSGTERCNDAGAILKRRALRFVSAYHEVSPLSEDEIRALPDLICDEATRRILQILETHYFGGDTSCDGELPRLVALLDESSLMMNLFIRKRAKRTGEGSAAGETSSYAGFLDENVPASQRPAAIDPAIDRIAALLRYGKNELATRKMQEYRESHPEDDNFRFFQASTLAGLGALYEAIDCLHRLLARRPENGGADRLLKELLDSVRGEWTTALGSRVGVGVGLSGLLRRAQLSPRRIHHASGFRRGARDSWLRSDNDLCDGSIRYRWNRVRARGVAVGEAPVGNRRVQALVSTRPGDLLRRTTRGGFRS